MFISTSGFHQRKATVAPLAAITGSLRTLIYSAHTYSKESAQKRGTYTKYKKAKKPSALARIRNPKMQKKRLTAISAAHSRQSCLPLTRGKARPKITKAVSVNLIKFRGFRNRRIAEFKEIFYLRVQPFRLREISAGRLRAPA